METTRLLSLASLIPLLASPFPQEEELAPRNVAILLFPGVELLDFAGPGEVFAAARADGRDAFRVYTVAERKDELTSQGFVRIRPEFSFADCPRPDVLVVPGGNVPLSNEVVRDWVRERAAETETTMSVCNGALLLADAGLLKGLEVTTHHGSLLGLTMREATAKVYENRRFVDSGRVLTTAGVSAGIDGSLHLVGRLLGEEVAQVTARYMEYDWRPEEIAAQHAEPGRSPLAAVEGLLEKMKALGEEGALAHVRGLGDAAPDERQVNVFGYYLVGTERWDDAVRILSLNAALHPASANACDSLSEALEGAGRTEDACAWARKALEQLESDPAISPGLAERVREGATARIQRLESGTAALFLCPPCGQACDEERHAKPGLCAACGMTLQPARAEAGGTGSSGR